MTVTTKEISNQGGEALLGFESHSNTAVCPRTGAYVLGQRPEEQVRGIKALTSLHCCPCQIPEWEVQSLHARLHPWLK